MSAYTKFLIIILLASLLIVVTSFGIKYFQAKRITNNPIPISLLAPPDLTIPSTQQQFLSEVKQQAKAADLLEINQCAGNPLVLKAFLNQPIKYLNKDQTPNLLKLSLLYPTLNSFKPLLIYTLPSLASQLKIDSAQKNQVYSYTCNDSSDIKGLIYIE